MASRNFKPLRGSLEYEVVKIYAKCAIGAAGAVSSIEGTGVSTITAEAGASGQYSITLEDNYSKFLFGGVVLAHAANGTAKTAVTGTSEVATFTFVAKASCTSGDFAVITDTNGDKWGFAIDKTGSAPEPTSALWTSIAAGKKVNIDISGATTDANVATAIQAAFSALSGISAVITVGSSVGATVPCTHVYRKNVANAAVYQSDGSATPTSMTVATSPAGIDTAVDVTANTITFTAHGLYTGRAVALSIGGGSLPAGLSATTYYVVVVDANTIKFATSLANAEAGTVVDITDYGTASNTMTITPSAVLGAQVARVEFLDTVAANVQSAGKIYFNAYNYSGAAVQIANGTTMFIELALRNSDIKSKGES